MTVLAARAGRRRTSGVTTGVPAVLVLPALLGATFLLLPSIALLVDAPWTQLPDILRTGEVRDALRLSLICATGATALSLVVGVPLAWVLARVRFRGLGLLRAAVLLPLVLPPVAGGVALFSAFGRLGLVGQPVYRATGFQLPFTTWGVVVAEAFVAMPFLVVSAEGAFRTVDSRLEEAATTLGASRAVVFRRVVVPTVGPALVAGSVLCWARALGEFGATITFAGNLRGTTQTMPLLVSLSLDVSLDRAKALALVLMVISVVVLASLRDRWLRTPSATA
ncbi:molybdate ABC transporter permease subunit [Jatrophihabitans sp. YIM 134969]